MSSHRSDIDGVEPERTDHRLNGLLIASIITAAVLVLFAGLALPRIVNTTGVVEVVRTNSDVGACRAVFRTDIDDAMARLNSAKARLEERNAGALEALARGGNDALITFLNDGPQDLRTKVTELAVALDARTDVYIERIALSRTDPEAFLELCAVGR